MSTTYTITSQQLAERLPTNPATIRAYRAGQRQPALLIGLPDPIQTQPRLLWLVADIEAWLESRRTFRPAAPEAPTPPAEPSRKRGRPTKAEQARRARLTAELERAAADIQQLKTARKVAEQRGEQ